MSSNLDSLSPGPQNVVLLKQGLVLLVAVEVLLLCVSLEEQHLLYVDQRVLPLGLGLGVRIHQIEAVEGRLH